MSDNSQYLSAFCFRDNIHKHTSGAYACLAILSRIARAKFPTDTLSWVKISLAITWAPNALKKAFNSSRWEEEGLGRKVNRFLPTLSHGLTEGGRLGQRLLAGKSPWEGLTGSISCELRVHWAETAVLWELSHIHCTSRAQKEAISI